LFLIDVGCSGGLATVWCQVAAHDLLRAVGFDPLVAEVERLNASNTNPGVRYEAAFVGCRHFDQLFPPELRNDRIASRNNDPFPRVSAVAAMHRLQTSYVQDVFNAGAPVVLSDRFLTLDEYVRPEERAQVDFVKIDTDGHDIEVVLGSEQLMDAGGALGFSIEVQLHGATHEYANTFANIDRVMRAHGFTLYDLQTHRYSRTALPAPFELDLTAQTVSGQQLWGDALYFRDLAAPEYERMWPGYDVTPERVLKLACLFDLFHLGDCSAELVVNRASFLDPALRSELLDELVSGEAGSYEALVREFEADFTSFYPSRRTRQASPPPTDTPPAPAVPANPPPGASDPEVRHPHEEVQTLRIRLNELKQRNRELRQKLAERNLRLKRLTARLEASKSKA
jgi:FkbM family methyltransferase